MDLEDIQVTRPWHFYTNFLDQIEWFQPVRRNYGNMELCSFRLQVLRFSLPFEFGHFWVGFGLQSSTKTYFIRELYVTIMFLVFFDKNFAVQVKHTIVSLNLKQLWGRSKLGWYPFSIFSQFSVFKCLADPQKRSKARWNFFSDLLSLWTISCKIFTDGLERSRKFWPKNWFASLRLAP